MDSTEQMLYEGEFKNFIGGKFISYTHQKFKVNSPFYDYSFNLPDSDLTDLTLALSSAKVSKEKLETTSLGERVEILKNTANSLDFSGTEIDYAIKMIGMPRNILKQRSEFVKSLFKEIPKIYECRNGYSKEFLGKVVNGIRNSYEERKGIEYQKPLDGVIAAFLPNNDIAVSAFVLAHTTLTGNAIVMKPSSQEAYFSIKFAKALTDNGYPAGALNVITWDTENKSKKELSYHLIENTSTRIIFGSDDTIRQLRYKETDNGIVNYGSKGNFVGFGTGRSKAIVDEDTNVAEVARDLTEAALYYPIGCNSLKAAFVVKNVFNDVKDEIIKQFNKKTEKIGDPLLDSTEVGYIEQSVLDKYIERVKSAKAFGSIDILYGNTKKINNYQISPLLLSSCDETSEFLEQEYPTYVLCLKPVEDFKTAVEEVNRASEISSEDKKSLVTSIYTKNPMQNIDHIKKINAHHININRPTHFLNFYLPHQGIFLGDVLTESISLTADKNFYDLI